MLETNMFCDCLKFRGRNIVESQKLEFTCEKFPYKRSHNFNDQFRQTINIDRNVGNVFVS